jgi:RimJ/RimL family protein N-acetyltransferase
VISLRPYTAADVVFAREHLYGEVAGELQWFGFTPPRLQADFEATGLLTEDAGRLVVDEDGRPVGGLQFFHKTWGPPALSWCWEIGISVQAEHRGRGVGTAAQVLLRDYLFAHTRAERVQAVTDVANTAEQRALVKAGFALEGRLRSAQWRGGAWHDQLLYAVLRDDPRPPLAQG